MRVKRYTMLQADDDEKPYRASTAYMGTANQQQQSICSKYIT